MVTAYNLGQATKLIGRCQEVVKNEMPNAKFVLKGIDNEAIYFNVVCTLSKTNQNEIEDIKAKTYFYPYAETTDMFYKGSFIVSYNPSATVTEGSAKELFN